MVGHKHVPKMCAHIKDKANAMSDQYLDTQFTQLCWVTPFERSDNICTLIWWWLLPRCSLTGSIDSRKDKQLLWCTIHTSAKQHCTLCWKRYWIVDENCLWRAHLHQITHFTYLLLTLTTSIAPFLFHFSGVSSDPGCGGCVVWDRCHKGHVWWFQNSREASLGSPTAGCLLHSYPC